MRCVLMVTVFVCAIGINAGITNAQDPVDAVTAEKARVLGTLVYTDVTVQFRDTPADVAFAHLEQITGVHIHVRYGERMQPGIDPELPLNLDVEARPALEVLEQMLAQCSIDEACTWQFARGRIEAGLKSDLARTSGFRMRLYDVHDLLLEPLRFDNAPSLNIEAALQQGLPGQTGTSGGRPIFDEPAEVSDRLFTDGEEDLLDPEIVRAIRAMIEPEIWRGQGGQARIQLRQGAIIVNAPDFVHRKLAGYAFAPTRPEGTPRQRSVSFTDDQTIIEDVQDQGEPRNAP